MKAKRILSFVLACCILFTAFPTGIFDKEVAMKSEAATTPVNYNVFEQNDTVWKDFDPSGGADPCPIGPQGCGLFSVANAVYHLTGNTVDMRELSVWAWTNGYYKAAGATYRWQLYPNLAAKFGTKYGFTTPVTWKNGKASDTQLLNHLANGGTAVAHVYGHFICLAGYDAASGRVLVLDSAPDYERRFTQSGGSWLTVSELSGESSYMIVTGYCLLSKSTSSVVNYTATTSVASGSGSVFFSSDNTSWKFGAGSTVFFKTIPASGYKVSSITVNGTSIAVSNNGDTASYAFTMPSANATVSVKFTTGGNAYNTALLTSAAAYDVNAGLITRADCAVPNSYVGLFPASVTTYTKNNAVFYYSAPQYWYFGIDSASGPYSTTRHLQSGLRGGNYLSYGAGSFKVVLFNSSGTSISNVMNVTLSGTANHYGALTFIPGNSTGGNTGGGTTGGTDTTLYTVSISSSEGGTAHFGNGVLSGQVTAGTVVNYQVDPSSGYVVSKILINGVSQTIQNDGASYVYNFIMTAQTTTISVTFAKANSAAFPSNDIIFDNSNAVSWITTSGVSDASIALTTDSNNDTYMKITAKSSPDPQVNMNFSKLTALSASSYKYIVVTARTTSSNTFAKMYLCPGSISGATEDCATTWNWKNDGLWHDYLIDLSGKSNWTGNLNLIRFDFFDGTTSNGMALDLRSIKFYTSAPSSPTIKTDKTVYNVGENITLTYSGLDSHLGTQQNQIPFIAIYATGSEPGSAAAGLYTMISSASGKAVYPNDAVGGLYYGKTLAPGKYTAWIAYDAYGTSGAYNLNNVHYAAASSSYEFTIAETSTPTLHKVSTKIVSGEGVAHFGNNVTSADVYSGTTFNYQVTPNTGYKVSKISINGVDQTILNNGGDAIYSYTMKAEDTVISVTFAKLTYKITISSVSNGTVTLKDSSGNAISSGSSVAYGTKITVTATPNTGYKLSSLKAGSTSLSSGGTFTVSAATTVTATFAKKTYAITITNPTGATITLKDASGNAVASGASVAHGTVLTVTLTPSSGYRIKTVTVGGTSKKTYTTMSTTAVTYSHTVSAATTISGTAGKIFKVSFSQPTGGKVAVTNNADGATISSGAYVDTGTVIKVTVTESTGYDLSTLKAGSTSISNGDTYTVSAATTVKATYVKEKYTVTISASNGTVTLKDASGNAIASGDSVEYGTVITVTATPSTGYKLSTLKAGSTSLSNGGTFTLTAATTVKGTFTKQSYTMTITNPTGGTITVTDADGNAVTTGTSVAYKSVLTVTLTPSSGYRVKTITVNGTSKKTNSTISNAAVTYSYTVGAAAFTLSGTCGKIYKVSYSQATGGTIAVTNNADGAAISSGSYVDTGTVIKVTVTESTGYDLSTLKAGSTSIENGGTYTVSAATTVKATFTATEYNVTIAIASGSGTATFADGTSATTATIGQSVSYTLTPATGYKVSKITVNGASVSVTNSGATATYTLTMTAEDTTISVTFAKKTYAVSVGEVSNGTVTLSKTGSISYNTTITVTATPNEGYELDQILVNGTAITGTTFKVTKASTVTATFKKIQCAVSVGTVSNGTVTLSKTGTVDYGTTITVTATPSTGYKLDQILVNGTAISGTTFTVTEAATVTATFTAIEYNVTIAIASGSGTATFSDGTTTTKGTIGQSISYTLTPATGYKVSKITVNGTSVTVTNSGATATYTLTMTAEETEISVTFAKKKYTVSIGEVTNGTVTLSKTGSISYNTTITVTATPNEGYELDQILVNGTAISGTTFKVKKASEVTATFKKIQYAVSVGTVSNGTVKLSATGNIDYGTTITITATPSEGYKLSQILVNGTAISGTTFTVTGNSEITALFTKLVLDKVGTGASSGDSSVFVEMGGKASDVIAELKASLGTASVTITKDGEAVADTAKLGTGMVVTAGTTTYTVVVKGDVDGDGDVTQADASAVMADVLGTTTLTGANKDAAFECSGKTSGKLSILDVMALLNALK